MTVSLLSLMYQETKAQIYATALSIAEGLGLPVTSWQPGDPTRSLYHLEAEVLSKLEVVASNFIKAGFLEYAPTSWLKVIAKQVYNVDVPAASYATTTVVLTNSAGGLFEGEDLAPGALTFENSATGKKYKNTTGGSLAPGVPTPTTLSVTVVAEEAGSDSTAGAGEIDTLVTALPGVTCTNALAAIGSDEWDRDTIIAQCRDKLGMLSPNGPREAYSFVARNSELTGTSVVTRVRVYADSDTGDVTVYVASASGTVGATDLDLIEEAILTWATPLCITPTVLSATPVAVDIEAELSVYRSVNRTEAELTEDIEASLETMFAARPIGGDIVPPALGALYHALIVSTIRETYPDKIFNVVVPEPVGDTELDPGEVAALGSVSLTINFVEGP